MEKFWRLLSQSQSRITDRSITRQAGQDPDVKSALISKYHHFQTLTWIAYAYLMHLEIPATFRSRLVQILAQCDPELKSLAWLLIRHVGVDPVLLMQTLRKDLRASDERVVCAAVKASLILRSNDELLALARRELLELASESTSSTLISVLNSTIRIVDADLEGVLKSGLADRDPSVMFAALRYLERAEISVGKYVPTVCHILNQIVTGKLPTAYEYHGCSAPWIQCRLLRVLQRVASPLSDEHAFTLTKTLRATILKASEGVDASFAVLLECAKTASIMSLTGSNRTELKTLFQPSIDAFICAKNMNLRYIGLALLRALLECDRQWPLKYQMEIVDCLDTFHDRGIQTQTLLLLFDLANDRNAKMVVLKTTEFLRKFQPSGELMEKMLSVLSLLNPNDLVSCSLDILKLIDDFDYRRRIGLKMLACMSKEHTQKLFEALGDDSFLMSLFAYHFVEVRGEVDQLKGLLDRVDDEYRDDILHVLRFLGEQPRNTSKVLSQDRIDALKKELAATTTFSFRPNMHQKVAGKQLRMAEYAEPSIPVRKLSLDLESPKDEYTRLLPDQIPIASQAISDDQESVIAVPAQPIRRRDRWTLQGYQTASMDQDQSPERKEKDTSKKELAQKLFEGV